MIWRASVVRRLARRAKRVFVGEKLREYPFLRLELESADSRESRTIRQLENVLSYTKTSGSRYSAQHYPAGYHTLRINGYELHGQRDPARRLERVPIDFTGKTVLDLGCNQGGMLFGIRDKIKWAVGVDYDPKMINAANRIRSVAQESKLDFYVLDLEQEPLELINDFLPEPRVDVVFLLAVCMWLENWHEVINFARSISESMLFETNGTDEQQSEQERYLRDAFRFCATLSETSDDDDDQKHRKLLYLTDGLER